MRDRFSLSPTADSGKADSGPAESRTAASGATARPRRRAPASAAARGRPARVAFAASAAAFAGLLAGCSVEGSRGETPAEELIRSVKTEIAQPQPAQITRRFPAVLEPPQIVPLAFETGGRVSAVDLRVGQQVEAGALLATIEPIDLELRLQQSEAAFEEAKAAAANARDDANRQIQLLERNAVSLAARDRAVAEAEQAEARLAQAARSLDLLRESRADAELRAPFDGVINTVDVQDFASVEAGRPVITLYEDGVLQATILVSYDVVSTLRVGRALLITPADRRGEALAARITEIGRRAAAVSSFPVVVTLDRPDERLRSGMAVEVQIDIDLLEAGGHIALPRNAIATHRPADFEGDPPFSADVFVFTPTQGRVGTIAPRRVSIAASGEREVFIGEGLAAGEIVVTAGVPFLRPGQRVRLMDDAGDVAGAHPAGAAP